MRPALPGELYENLALITGHCMEYTLACIWCYYYDDGLEIEIIHVLILGSMRQEVGIPNGYFHKECAIKWLALVPEFPVAKVGHTCRGLGMELFYRVLTWYGTKTNKVE